MRRAILSMFLSGLVLFAYAQRTVSGKVVSAADGSSVPGVTIIVKGTSNGVTSDVDGNYSLNLEEGQDILIFSFIGLATQEINIGSRSVIDVSMTEDVEQLQEVVVTAFGLERDKDQLGYSAQNVSSESMMKSSETNLINAMNGKVAGVQITSAGGAPGASSNILIRGASSISGNNQPLFVVDGIPVDNTTDASDPDGQLNGANFNDYGKTVGSNRVSDINPADIETMTILKGGAATALYGLRAVNGAVLITTKSGNGAQQGLNVNLTTSYSIEKPNKYPEFQSAYTRGRNGAYSNVTHWSWGPAYADNPVFPDGTTTDIDGDGALDDVSGQQIPLFEDNYRNFWQDGRTARTNVSVSNAGPKSSFYSSLGMTDQTGIIPNSSYKKYNFSLKGSFDVTDKFNVGGYASFVNTTRVAHEGANNGFGQGLGYWHNMWDISDDRPWKNPANGQKTWFSNFVPDPRWIAHEEAETSTVDRVIGNFNFNYAFADWLSLSYRVGVDMYSDNKDLMRPISSPNSTNQAGDFYEIRIASRDLTSSLMLNGKADLGSNLELSYMIGNDVWDKNYDRMYTFGEGLSIQGFRDISNASVLQARNTITRKRIIGLFGEVALSWNDELFVSVTGRNDKSSTLPVANNSFFYPSVSLGYVFSERLGSGGPLEFGKIKASIAQVGNDAPVYLTSNIYANSPSESLTSGTNVNINGPARFSVSSTQGNNELKPEISTTYDVGFETRAFGGLIGLDFTYYQRNTKDQVLLVPLSSTTGYGAIAQNAGEVRNQGIEAILSYNNILKSVTSQFNWSGFINFTKNTNEVVSVPEGLEEIVMGYSYWNGATIVARPGIPLGSYVGPGYKRNDSGVLLLDDDGYPQLGDENIVLGDPNPDFIMGINNSFGFKGIRLDATLEIRQGGEILNDSEAFWVYSGMSKTTEERFYDANSESSNATRVFDGIIESTGQQSDIAAPLDNTYYHGLNSFVDEAHIEDASWLRLRTLSLTYSLPTSLLGDGFFRSVDISLLGRNLWLKTEYSGVDPEVNAFGANNVQGIDLIGAPGTKSFGASLNVKF
ncbi:MAG: SusC/RagA family TonB-linked outer membrane protein [Cyclobacteriaceae bacterium]